MRGGSAATISQHTLQHASRTLKYQPTPALNVSIASKAETLGLARFHSIKNLKVDGVDLFLG
jgi:hypothetical protein